jgi:glycosyltransferase involved in cell wall biosynthesis
MHIVFVIAPGGGPDANVKTLAPELARRGHHVSVIYTVTRVKVSPWSDLVRFRFAPVPSLHYYTAKVTGSYRAWPLRIRAWEQARAVRRVLEQIEREEHIDVVEVTEGFSAGTLVAKWPIVFRAHGSDWTFRQFCGDGDSQADDLLRAQQRQQFLKAQAATALSDHLAQHLNEALQLAPPARVLPYGIDTDAFSPNSHSHFSPPVLLTVGRLERRKGVNVLLRAMPDVWRHFPDTQVRLIGSEADLTREELLAMTPEDKRKQIVFPGFLERQELIEEYQHASVYVAPTQYETFGYTVLEAMACGRPVISTRVGAIPELIEDGENGLLVPWNDSAALAEAILKVLSDPDGAAGMGAAGRARAIADFSLARIVERNLESYQRAIVGNAHRHR